MWGGARRARADGRRAAPPDEVRSHEVRHCTPRLVRGLVLAVGKGSGDWEKGEMKLFGPLASVINKLPWVVVGAGIIFASAAGILGGSVSKSLQSGGFQDAGSQSGQGGAGE